MKSESSFVLISLRFLIKKKNLTGKFSVDFEVSYNYVLLQQKLIKHQMMKILSIATFMTILFFYSICAVSIEKRRTVLMTALNECKAKENAPESDFEKIIATQLPETRQGFCLIACVLEDFAIVSSVKFFILFYF